MWYAAWGRQLGARAVAAGRGLRVELAGVCLGCRSRPRRGAALGPRERLPVDRRDPRDRAAKLGYTDDLGNLVR